VRHNGDELLATLRYAEHEIVAAVIRNVDDFISKMLRLEFARARMRYEILSVHDEAIKAALADDTIKNLSLQYHHHWLPP
jgi:hypothetical protein